MTTTTLTYGKVISSVTETNNTGKVETFKVSQLPSKLADLVSFDMRLGKSVLTKTVRLIESLGFTVSVDETYGFEWEVNLNCTK